MQLEPLGGVPALVSGGEPNSVTSKLYDDVRGRIVTRS